MHTAEAEGNSKSAGSLRACAIALMPAAHRCGIAGAEEAS
jgi:hypothetical protein